MCPCCDINACVRFKRGGIYFIPIHLPFFSLSAVAINFRHLFCLPERYDGDNDDVDLNQILNFKAEKMEQGLCRAQRLSDSNRQL